MEGCKPKIVYIPPLSRIYIYIQNLGLIEVSNSVASFDPSHASSHLPPPHPSSPFNLIEGDDGGEYQSNNLYFFTIDGVSSIYYHFDLPTRITGLSLKNYNNI